MEKVKNVIYQFVITSFIQGFGFHGIPWIGDRSHRVPTALGIEPQSSGCVRMHDELARYLYERLPKGAPVDIPL